MKSLFGEIKQYQVAHKSLMRFITIDALKKTALYNLHLENGGKMVNFSGWSLPIQYKDGIMESTLHTRSHASLFDVSHMGQLKFIGPDRVKFLDTQLVSNVKALKLNTAKYTLLTNEEGGIIDDSVITLKEDHIHMVINAGRVDVDIPHIQKNLDKFVSEGGDVSMKLLDKHSLIALQGPSSAKILQELIGLEFDLSTIRFFEVFNIKIKGIACQISRSGYTGEDGFEISVDDENAPILANSLLSNDDVKFSGLGARDALRLEAGLCLYGNDLTENINPVEAGLMWTIGKKRRLAGGFLGAESIQKYFKDGPKEKRVGLFVNGAPARGGAKILDSNSLVVGRITSGAFSPTLKRPIAMGYVRTDLSVIGTNLQVMVRSRKSPAEVVKMPFVPTNYNK